MLGAKYKFAQSMDCATQNMDPVLYATIHDPWIARAINGSRVSKGAKYKFADNPWIALRAQTTDCLVCSQIQSKDKLHVSGIALASQLVYTSHVRINYISQV